MRALPAFLCHLTHYNLVSSVPPIPEDSALLSWHEPEGLQSAGGEAEAKTFLAHLQSAAPGRAKVEYDESGRFPTNGNASALTAKLDAADAGWEREQRFHVELDPVTANVPARYPTT